MHGAELKCAGAGKPCNAKHDLLIQQKCTCGTQMTQRSWIGACVHAGAAGMLLPSVGSATVAEDVYGGKPSGDGCDTYFARYGY